MTAKKFEVEITVPEGLKAGDAFKVTVEAPELPKQSRGQLNGLSLEEMTDEQLKRELINANSVLYKAKKRDAAATTVAENEARVEAVKAEKAKRNPVPTATVTGAVVTPEDGTTPDETVDQDSASEM